MEVGGDWEQNHEQLAKLEEMEFGGDIDTKQFDLDAQQFDLGDNPSIKGMKMFDLAINR